MSGDGNLDPDDAQRVEIEESWTTYHGKIKQLKVETVKIPMYEAYWKGQTSKYYKCIESTKQNRAAEFFKLFISRSFLDKIRKRTNQCLKEDGMREVNETKFDANIGLKLAMSLFAIQQP